MAKGRDDSMRRTLAVALLLTVLVLACAFVLFKRTVYEPTAPPPMASTPVVPAPVVAPAAPAIANEEAVVLAVAGPVLRARAKGDWTRLVPGDRLRADESVRTGKGGRTELRVGADSNLAVTESTQVTIRELTTAVHRFKLDRGRLAVDYKPSGERVLKIESEGNTAVAETKGARFSVLSNGSTLAVATETGSVNLGAAGQQVAVPEGQSAFVRTGESPSAPVAVPALPVALLLKVAESLPAENETLCARVTGVASPGSEVTVDGVPAPLDREGHFNVAVPRKPRTKTAVLVAMRDVSGREQNRSVPCSVLDPSIDNMNIRWRKGARAQ
ncbi:MAG: FecR domain-containing protein [Deltaproteobacteria bacterium]|nr:FecR domain-containing protein [Deltaproteobacteria bacterium]